MNVASKLNLFEQKNVIIVGDVMIDRYLTGSVSRISPEAPVPVVLQRSMEDRLGGAANVALNVQALGAVPLLCSVVGDDPDGRSFVRNILPGSKIQATGILTSAQRRTTVKTRVLGNNQQMLRIDQEDNHDLNQEESEKLLSLLRKLLDQQPVTALILQDYNKGVLTATLIPEIIYEAKKRGIFTSVDPKKNNFWAYQQVNLFKPNMKEIRDCVPFSVEANEDSLQKAADFIREKLKNAMSMITLSEKGLFLEGETNVKGKLYPTQARNVADVSGAGDTVISIASLALALGFELDFVAQLSNAAGGQVCESPGVVPVDRGVLERELKGEGGDVV